MVQSLEFYRHGILSWKRSHGQGRPAARLRAMPLCLYCGLPLSEWGHDTVAPPVKTPNHVAEWSRTLIGQIRTPLYLASDQGSTLLPR
jgi:hypothetical protein